MNKNTLYRCFFYLISQPYEWKTNPTNFQLCQLPFILLPTIPVDLLWINRKMIWTFQCQESKVQKLTDC